MILPGWWFIGGCWRREMDTCVAGLTPSPRWDPTHWVAELFRNGTCVAIKKFPNDGSKVHLEDAAGWCEARAATLKRRARE